MSASNLERFTGSITGIGTSSGVRVVVGQWHTSPLGRFADVMLQDQSDRRILLAPSPEIAEFISQTYVFDEVLVVPVRTGCSGATQMLTAGPLQLSWRTGRRTLIGTTLRMLPSQLAGSPIWCRAIDPLVRVLLRGVRTAGTARDGRREFYGGLDQHAVTWATGSWAGAPLGELRPVTPAVTFGFGSTPERPSRTAVVSTVSSG